MTAVYSVRATERTNQKITKKRSENFPCLQNVCLNVPNNVHILLSSLFMNHSFCTRCIQALYCVNAMFINENLVLKKGKKMLLSHY